MARAPSKRAGPPDRRRADALTPDDEALWAAVAKTVRRRLSNTPDHATALKNGSSMTDHAPQPQLPTQTPSMQTRPAPTAPGAPAPTPSFQSQPEPKTSVRRAPPQMRLGPSTPGLDRRTAERLRKGKIEPDARLDLHGLTSARAHGALTSFIMREQAAGSRCVLVITGKGGRRVDPSHGWRELGPGEGVLKNLTPQWLAQPPLSDLVIGVYPANIRHGGAGALYVYLRKRR